MLYVLFWVSAETQKTVVYLRDMNDCIFCKIVAGEIPSHKVWESKTHLAFLTIFPNTDGATVVIPKKHYPSYALQLPDDALLSLMQATKIVAEKLDKALHDVGRTALVFEGFGIDHVHAKLFPMHGTKDMGTWKPIKSNIDHFFKKYEGYISSHDGKRADDKELALLAAKIRAALT